MTKCLIIGGGFAGLSAASYLADKGIKVHLLEASPKLGGRAYSFPHIFHGINKEEKCIVDNGQHILMGCYKNTIDFLHLIGAEKNISFQKKLKINFVDKGGVSYKLDASKLFYPINLIIGILAYKAVSIKERFSIIALFLKILFLNPDKYRNITVYDWLKKENQSSITIKSLWEILVVGTLNTIPKNASAEIFIKILKEIFFKGNKSTVVVLPNVGLSEMYCADSKKFIESNGGEISTSEKVNELIIKNKKVINVVTNNDNYTDFDFVISAVPFYSLKKIIKDIDSEIGPNIQMEYSPILTVHLWLNENPFKEEFYGLIDSKVHWLFNHGTYLTLVTSAAEDFVGLNDTEIMKIIYSELGNYFPIFYENFVSDFLILKEKRATFIPTIELTKLRYKLKFPFENLFIAGDWINTGLPSTIEGAVLSGRIAADSVFSNI